MSSAELAAPGVDPDAEALPWYRAAWRRGLGYQAPAVLFLGIPVVIAWQSEPQLVWPLLLTVLTVAVLYAGSTVVAGRSIGFRIGWCLAIWVALGVLGVLTQDLSVFGYYLSFGTVPMVALLPWCCSRIAIPVLGVFGIACSLIDQDLFALSLAVFGIVIALSIGQGLQSDMQQYALNRERERTAALAVVAERERIGRDLHDILGHSLTAIAVKTELAGKLIERDPQAAKTQIDEVTAVARQALADVRATASRIREVRIAGEIASARSVLAAADIECIAPSGLPAYSDAQAELFGYVVREAVTNVVRHAGARQCVITASENQVQITDDGRGLAGTREGSGLRGLRERVSAAGGELDVTSTADGTSIRCELTPTPTSGGIR